MKIDISLSGVHLRKPVPYTRGGKQGGTETPRVFCRLLDSVMQEVGEIWQTNGCGFWLSELNRTITHTIWADNIYLFGSSITMIESMLDTLRQTLYKWKLLWKPSSLACLPNAAARVQNDRSGLILQAVTGQYEQLRCPVVSEIIALGVCLDDSGSAGCSVRYRLSMASKHWQARRKQLCCKKAPLRARIARFYQTVVRTLLYGSGGWTPSVGLFEILRCFELRCLRAILARPRADDETYITWAQRSNAVLKTHLCAIGQESVCSLWLKSFHGWAGHVMRIPSSFDLHWVARWRTTQWWLTLQAVALTSSDNSWRHFRPGTYSRWDSLLVHVHGEDWADACYDRRAWSKAACEFGVAAITTLAGDRATRFVWHPLQDHGFEFNLSGAAFERRVHELQTLHSSWVCASDTYVLSGCPRLVICMDSDATVQMVNGDSGIADPVLKPQIQKMQDTLASWHCAGFVQPWCSLLPFLRHIPRSCNQYADALANEALDSQVARIKWFRSCNMSYDALLLHTDGASRGNPGMSATGVVLSVRVQGQWLLAAVGNSIIGEATNSQAESMSLELGLKIVHSFISGVLILD